MTQNWRDGLENYDEMSYFAGVTSAFAEVVAAGVKPLALSHPYSQTQLDAMLTPTRVIAAGYGVEIWVETDLLVTPLFPADVAKGKKVIFLIENEAVLAKYQALKLSRAEAERTGRLSEVEMELGRSFGRLLGYQEDKIEAMLANA